MRSTALTGLALTVALTGAYLGCSNDAENCALNPILGCGPYGWDLGSGGGSGGKGRSIAK